MSSRESIEWDCSRDRYYKFLEERGLTLCQNCGREVDIEDTDSQGLCEDCSNES